MHFLRKRFWEIFSLGARQWLSLAAAEDVSEHFLCSNIITGRSQRFIQSKLSNYTSVSRQWLSLAAAEDVSEHFLCSNITRRSQRFIQSKLSNYNSVSRGQSAIIQGFQVIIRWLSGGIRAACYSPSARETDFKHAIHVVLSSKFIPLRHGNSCSSSINVSLT